MISKTGNRNLSKRKAKKTSSINKLSKLRGRINYLKLLLEDSKMNMIDLKINTKSLNRNSTLLVRLTSRSKM